MVAYVTSIERIGMQKGIEKGQLLALLAIQLGRRFGALPTEPEFGVLPL